MTSATAAARTILTRLHEVMASRLHAQAKLNQVVEIIGDSLDSEVSSERSDLAVDALVRAMHNAGLLPVQAQEEIYLAADTIIVSGDTVYYIKPQAQRLWLLRQAHRDAERIVRTTLKPTSQSQEAA